MSFTRFILLFLALISFTTFAIEIPYAKRQATQRVVRASQVEKQNGPFECLECGAELILRRGAIRQAHFAHKAEAQEGCGGGAPESIEHRLAKELLADHLARWTFIVPCNAGSHPVSSQRFAADLSTKLEFHHGPYVVDVMVMQATTVVAALEVRHTHAVDADKRQYFAENHIPLIEVSAKQVISSFNQGTFRAYEVVSKQCDACKVQAQRDAEELQRRSMRPCLQCKTWLLPAALTVIAAPPGHLYPSAFACATCVDYCPTCTKPSTKDDLRKFYRCLSCNMSHKRRVREEQAAQELKNQEYDRWRFNLETALRNKAVGQVESLLRQAPEECEHLERYQNELTTLKEEQEVERQRAEQRQREVLLQYEQEFKEKVQKLTEEIIASNRVDLRVPYRDKEIVKQYKARWTGNKDAWYVTPEYIKECARWTLVPPEVVTLVAERMANKPAETGAR